jgi:aldose sugar dehydrogenase
MLKSALAVICLAAPLALAQSVEALWANNCLLCHGQRGQGGPMGTSTLLDSEYLTDGTDRDLFNSIKEGHPDRGMQPFGETLSDPQIYGLVVYIRELQHRANPPRRTGQGPVQTQHHTYTVERIVERELSTPWSLDFFPDGSLIIANRNGDLRTFRDGRLSRPIEGTPAVRNLGQGGLMEVRLHPGYSENGWVYLSLADPIGEGRRSLGMTKVVRGKIAGGRWQNEETIFQADTDHYSPSTIHFGCKFAFDPSDSGILFFTIGERGADRLAQDLSRPNGAVHRVRDDGSIPADNPFVQREDAVKSIWSYGHRNPQGLAFDLDGNLWSTEHGPRGGDELNLIKKGLNYGWPLVSFGIQYPGQPLTTPWPDLQGLEHEIEMPVDVWTPSIAASGLTVVTGGMFPEWRGDLLAGGLNGACIDRIRIRDGTVVERERILQGLGRVRDVTCAPDGSIYIALNDPDHIIRLVRAE